MAWSEEKRKRIWGKKYNPAIALGMFFLVAIYSIGAISFIIGILLMYSGFKMYKNTVFGNLEVTVPLCLF